MNNAENPAKSQDAEYILVVDDLPENRLAFKSLLEGPQTIVVEAESGNEALKLALEHSYALILMDVQMPEMDGFETAILLRLNPQTREIPIIFVTAYDQKQEFMFKGYEAGAVDYIVKPLDPQILKSKIQIFCRLHRLLKMAQISSHMDEALTVVSTKLFSEENSSDSMNDALTHLLRIAGLSRVCIFENFQDSKDGLCMRLIHEVCAPNAKVQINNPFLQHLPYKNGFSDWSEKLSKGTSFHGRADTFPEEQKNVFRDQDIFSILIIPIMIARQWYGFMGFDQCHQVREWIEKDIQFLRTASEMVGTYLHRVRMEKNLKDNEERFRTITSMALDAIVMIDENGNISFWNLAAEKMFGFKEEEVLGKELHRLLAPSRYYEAHKKGFQQFIATGTGEAVGRVLELAAIRKDGTEFPIELSVAAVKRNDQWCAIGVIRDITKRKQREIQLQEAVEQLRLLHQTSSIKME